MYLIINTSYKKKMQYRIDQKSGNSLPVLGFGCMRFPKNGGKIDKDKTEKLLLQAYEQGVNYFDTAYLYPGSEETIGEIFEKHALREKVFIATKLPQYMCKKKEDFDDFFKEQKRRLRTDYVDYYFMHNISTFKQWEDLCELGIETWIKEKKASGEIKQVGFSFHGTLEDFYLMIDAYDWDFTQIQYNYMNTHYQAGTAGLKYAAKKGLPVFIMEPLLGGKLAVGLPKKAMDIIEAAEPGSTPASWGLRWLFNQPEVTLVLSGMNEESQLKENLATAEHALPGIFGEKEEATVQQIMAVFKESYKVPCTGCAYCMPCPKGINIPGCFSAYNESHVVGWRTGMFQYVLLTGLSGDYPHIAKDCIKCGKCEKHCPQNIQIRQELKRVSRRFDIPGMKGLAKFAKKIRR